MAQIKTGKVQVIEGSAVVTGVSIVGIGGGPGVTSWDDILPGAIFAVAGQNHSYLINAVDFASVPPTLTLASPYLGATDVSVAGVAYCVTNDFTPNFRIPLLARNDIETATIFSRAMQSIDQSIGLRVISSVASAASINAGNGVVTITLTNHKLLTGQAVTLQGATPSTINGTHLITVTGANTFTYVVTGIAAATVSVMPVVSYRSAISLGDSHTLAGHTFKVGTVLRGDATNGFAFASSTGGEANGMIVGIVSSVSGSSFTLCASGPIYGLQGLPNSLTKGTVLYLSPTAEAVNLTATVPTTGMLKIPVFVVLSNNAAEGAVFGQVLNFPTGLVPEMAGSTASVAGASGAVPAPPASIGEKFLSNRGAWTIPPAQAGSVNFDTLIKTPTFTLENWTGGINGTPVEGASVYQALLNLNSRLVITENAQTGLESSVTITSSRNWTCPLGVSKIKVAVLGAGGGGAGVPGGSTYYFSGGGGGGGGYTVSILTVSPGTVYTVNVGLPGADGQPGGNSNFAGLIVANGGEGAPAGSADLGPGGKGGAIGTGTPDSYLRAGTNGTTAVGFNVAGPGGPSGRNPEDVYTYPLAANIGVGGRGGKRLRNSDGGTQTPTSPASGGLVVIYY